MNSFLISEQTQLEKSRKRLEEKAKGTSRRDEKELLNDLANQIDVALWNINWWLKDQAKSQKRKPQQKAKS